MAKMMMLKEYTVMYEAVYGPKGVVKTLDVYAFDGLRAINIAMEHESIVPGTAHAVWKKDVRMCLVK